MCISISDQTLRQVAGLLGVEYGDLMRSSDARREGQPAIYGLAVAQDAHDVYTAETEAEAVTAYVLAHSVFNIDFPRKLKNLLFFLQKYVIGIDDGTTTSGKVLTSLSKQ